MKTTIVQIGNSRGVRIPKIMLEQAGIAGEVEMKASLRSIVIRASAKPRAGWAKSFREMAADGDDKLLLPSFPATAWDKDEWEW